MDVGIRELADWKSIVAPTQLAQLLPAFPLQHRVSGLLISLQPPVSDLLISLQ
ncbi:hypothetical protein [Allomesorhizobium camelthorni]|uniref:Uncharacterized protein n=1 Tax=Allomesorhizobium camelthorni TaxID=475069 RepID=A0A6G4W7F6_9HYPH|nr:hypothetical protein [Mesorhizobium camelthorni]NGO50258.1 hypothetical protein [Mesorhizobium camelthorni]